MSRIALVAITILLLLDTSKSQTYAAKRFVPKKTTVKSAAVSGIPALISYRPDKLGLNLSFRSFTGLESVSYSFTYNTNGMAQGIGGKVTADNNPTAARELLFGTCSRGACRYHYNLSGARLILTAKYLNGRTASKSYRIKTYQ